MIGRLIAVTLTAALLLTACDGNSGGSATPPPFTPSTAPTSASTPVDPAALAGSEAVAAYRKYRQVIDTMTASGGQDVKGLDSVTTGVELKASLNQAATYRGRKIHSVGSIKVLWVRPVKVGSPSAGLISTATVQACYDTADAKAVDANGKSVRPPGLPTRWLDNRDLKLVDGAWKVAIGKNEAAKC